MIVRHLTSHDSVQELMARAPIDPAVDVLTRIRSEYREMPGLCLTLGQARRLWALDEGTCSRLLSNLVSEGYLRQSTAGYVQSFVNLAPAVARWLFIRWPVIRRHQTHSSTSIGFAGRFSIAFPILPTRASGSSSAPAAIAARRSTAA